jgi:hypothetical protein
MMKRAVSIVLIVVLLPQFTGCTVHQTERVEPAELEQPITEKIVGVTTVAGEEVVFDTAYVATVGNDTIYAVVAGLRRSFAMDEVRHVWLERTDAAASAALSILAVVGVATVMLGAIALVALATKESCPFVYSWDGERYVFDAEPYGGATTRGLERDDYSELERLKAEDGVYRMMLGNEVREAQYTDLLELWAVDHPPGTRVVADEFGKLYTISQPLALESARDGADDDLLRWLQTTDRLVWEPYAVAGPDGSLRHEIVMTFPKPEGASEARLVANVATGQWGSHMIREMLELRGREVGAWYDLIDTSPQAKLQLLAWNLREELYTLKLWVEEPTGWELRGLLPGGGPFIAEDRVVPLDVSRVPGDRLRIRVQPPAGFWAFNSFYVDYGTDQRIAVDTLAPLEAKDATGRDVLAQLRAADGDYHTMPRTGDRTYVVFPAAERQAGMERTLILHSRGYYRLHLSEEGEPDLATLQRLEDEPGYAARFAAERFAEWRMADAGGR